LCGLNKKLDKNDSIRDKDAVDCKQLKVVNKQLKIKVTDCKEKA